jgi:predicted transcriptional regulator
MHAEALQYAILRLIEFEHDRGRRAHGIQDVEIANAIGAEVTDVRQELEVLENLGFVRLTRAQGVTYSATLTYHKPRLRLLGGRLRCFNCHKVEKAN